MGEISPENEGNVGSHGLNHVGHMCPTIQLGLQIAILQQPSYRIETGEKQVQVSTRPSKFQIHISTIPGIQGLLMATCCCCKRAQITGIRLAKILY